LNARPPRCELGSKGVRLAGPGPLPQPVLTIQRKASSRGGIQVARQRIQVGFSHAGQTVTIQLGDTSLRVIDQHGELIATVPRNGTGEISRFRAYGTLTALVTATSRLAQLRTETIRYQYESWNPSGR
jgi:hypothetical protein